MAEVHQFVQSFVDHDAISSHVRHLQRVIRGMGIRSEVYAGEWRGDRSKATFFRDFPTTEDPKNTWLLYHLATASSITDYLMNRPERLSVNYHNITPYDFLAPWEPLVAPELEVARRQLKQLSGKTEAAIGVSQYNATELSNEGYRSTSVAPILFDPAEFHKELDGKVDAALRTNKEKGGSDWLFVGRITPHKCQHEVIKAFAVYKRLYDPNARLHLVGGLSSHLYWTVLRKYAETLDLSDSVNITLAVSNGALGAYYKNADVFVCMSEHEGFGVPLLEALYNEVPVVAYAAAAVPETLGSGGLVLSEKSPGLVAAAVNRVVSDDAVAKAMLDAGTKRLDDFSMSKSEEVWRETITKMIAA